MSKTYTASDVDILRHGDDFVNNSLEHFGILGMKWGIRRYQPYPSGKNGTYLGDKSNTGNKRLDKLAAKAQKHYDKITSSEKLEEKVQKIREEAKDNPNAFKPPERTSDKLQKKLDKLREKGIDEKLRKRAEKLEKRIEKYKKSEKEYDEFRQRRTNEHIEALIHNHADEKKSMWGKSLENNTLFARSDDYINNKTTSEIAQRNAWGVKKKNIEVVDLQDLIKNSKGTSFVDKNGKVDWQAVKKEIDKRSAEFYKEGKKLVAVGDKESIDGITKGLDMKRTPHSFVDYQKTIKGFQSKKIEQMFNDAPPEVKRSILNGFKLDNTNELNRAITKKVKQEADMRAHEFMTQQVNLQLNQQMIQQINQQFQMQIQNQIQQQIHQQMMINQMHGF